MQIASDTHRDPSGEAAQTSSSSIDRSRRPLRVSRRVLYDLLLLSEGLLVFGFGLLSHILSNDLRGPAPAPFHITAAVLGAITLGVVVRLAGGYRPAVGARLGRSVVTMLSGWGTAAVLMAALFALTGGDGPNDKAWFWAWVAMTTPALVVVRTVHHWMLNRLTQGGLFARHIAIYGIGPTGQQLLGNYFAESNPDVRIVGLFDDRSGRSPDFCCGYPVRGDLDELIAYAREHQVDEVIVALPFSAEERIEAVLTRLREVPADVKLAAPVLDVRGHVSQVNLLERRGRFPVVPVMRVPLSDWSLILKEIEDRVLGALILVLISPVLAIIAIAIKLDSPGPVFFRQMRWGYNNRMIEVLKFRSMRNDLTDANAEKLTTKDDPRVTKLGAFLRKTSLDELPQFINVVRGEMSIVGPRPHARAAKAGGLLYQDAVPDYAIRHKVKPGITGWAQINGWRGETQTVEQIQKRVEHDIEYVNKWSLFHDLKIIILTIFTGFTGKNAY